MRRVEVVACAFLVAGSALGTPNDGTIVGRMENRTPGGAPVAGIEVNLLSPRQSGDEPALNARTDNAGSFVFKGLDRDPDASYVVGARFEGVPYITDFASFEEGESSLDLDIRVYDATSDPSEIEIARVHTVIERSDEGGHHVRESIAFRNSGDRAFMPAEPGAVSFGLALFPGAGDLHHGGGFLTGLIEAVDGRASYHGPLYPGETTGLIGYSLPAGAPLAPLTRSFDYPVERLDLHVAEGVGGLVGEGWVSLEAPEGVHGVPYSSWSRAGARAGERVRIAFSDSARARRAGADPLVVLSIGIGALALVLLWVLAPFRGGIEAAAEIRIDPLADLERERAALLRSVRDLDFDHQMGKLSDEDYRPLRDELRARGVAITKELDARRSAGAKKRGASAPVCSECGATVRRKDRYCASCGASLAQPAARG
ncbi:MAG: hypothetical protein CME06_02075 [Gemmatimonadetes bacterium]|nr:hypothetical protein [Gemmatimonadota bacterium]